jgi:hypothetical protein
VVGPFEELTSKAPGFGGGYLLLAAYGKSAGVVTLPLTDIVVMVASLIHVLTNHGKLHV